MTNLNYYLTHAHAARGGTMLLSVAAGTGLGMFFEWTGAPVKVSVAVCMLVIGAIEVTRARRYVQPLEKKRGDADLLLSNRRSLVLIPVSVLLFLAVSLLPVPRIEAAVIEHKLEESANDPFSTQNRKDAEQSLAHAQAANIKLRPSVVESAGKKFLNAAESDPSDPSTWNTAQAFLNYRSFLNTDFQPRLENPAPVPADEVSTVYHVQTVAGTDFPQILATGKVPTAQAARLDQIGVNKQAGRPFGNAYLILDGNPKTDTLLLDGMDLKNVVVRDTQVFFTGGPVILENVCFVNCLLRITPNPNGILLATNVLKFPCVSFRAQ